MSATAEEKLESDIWRALHAADVQLDPVDAADLVDDLMFAAQRYAAADNTVATRLRREVLENPR